MEGEGVVVVHDKSQELLELLQRESERIQGEVGIEKEWWLDKQISDPIKEREIGTLQVVEDESSNTRLIGSLRFEKEPKVARKEVVELIGIIEKKWQEKARELGLDIEDIFLSISSLYRDPKLQDALKQSTHLSSKGFSSHTAGAAVDFDPRGYYKGPERTPINPNNPKYNARYTAVLKEVLYSLQAEGMCHLIIEHGYRLESDEVKEYEACYHVCAKPQDLQQSK